MKRVLALITILLLPAVLHAAEPYTKNVAIVLYNGVEILDFSGPAEVFAAAASFGSASSEKAFNVYTVSRTREPIVSQGFIDVIPDYSIEDAPRPDIVVFPGGGSDSVIGDPVWMEWARSTALGADQVLTVCTGAFIAAKAGLLDGLDATTFYAAVEGLARQYPKANVIPGRRFVDNGKVITTAGVSAGIDGSLHLVARLLGRYVADRTAEYMEYKWTPESYLSTKYSLLNPRLDARGRELQLASISEREGNLDRAVSIYRTLLAADTSDLEAALQLGRGLNHLKRYQDAVAPLLQASQGPAQRSSALYNLSCAYARIGERDLAIQTAGRAIESGFTTRHYFEHDEDLASVRDDPRFQSLLSALPR